MNNNMNYNGNDYGYENNYNNVNNPEMNYNSSNNYGVQKTNTLAIVGFILTFVPFISLIGWILCIIALFQIKKKGEKGKGLAIAGIVWPLVVSGIFIALMLFAFSFIWPAIKENITDTTVCSHGPLSNVYEDDNSLVCGEEVDGVFKCEFTVDGQTREITCDMNEE